MDREALLEVKNLKKYFPIKGGIFGKKTIKQVKAVDDVSFEVFKGETLGIVGESGCGKSTTGRALLRLLEPTAGDIYFQGKNIAHLKKNEMRMLRKDMQIVFQDPFASLNPRMKVGEIIEEPLINFSIGDKQVRKKRVLEIMEQVGLTPSQIDRYPHEFSGGQRQRIGIARALATNPKLIIADEPVSALDVSIQSQVLNLLKDLQKELDLTYIFISHDLSVVKHFCDRIGVMYLGKMVEIADKSELYHRPMHPYAQALLSAVPSPNPKKKKERIVLQGDVPSPSDPPSGCTFHPRCFECMDICSEVTPVLEEKEPGRLVSCHLYSDENKKIIV
ncbi:dipeptide/oligopeptide/nickel ABC transporter ATP-binding protein [[Bacillus] enclensis]|uniref:Peptide/nickel transport system ATP-binding protein n=1 Tax=[Bacillus] enclensis TaxID=1402860 RepID=A0A0V8HFN6_9BACI|nr:dipeptide ABC transporter ATP-binding protein [[Bacillus] enclensis]KSU61024.1 dipeptide/oligopeptide/nickel ABC transporter ATP-binding protein [[Bacillus] enclensis]SCC22019.1 peptide/nickel transport system ATP-binding protein [[Bacillus] enclensis]